MAKNVLLEFETKNWHPFGIIFYTKLFWLAISEPLAENWHLALKPNYILYYSRSVCHVACVGRLTIISLFRLFKNAIFQIQSPSLPKLRFDLFECLLSAWHECLARCLLLILQALYVYNCIKNTSCKIQSAAWYALTERRSYLLPQI